jgi:hypothetical protein
MSSPSDWDNHESALENEASEYQAPSCLAMRRTMELPWLWVGSSPDGKPAMVPSIFALIVLLVGAFLWMSAPAFATTLYAWRNADGSFVFTDNPRGAPPDVQVRVWDEWNPPESQPTLEPKPAPNAIAAVPPVEEFPDVVTQGEFAVRLVEELGLQDRPDRDRAADIL